LLLRQHIQSPAINENAESSKSRAFLPFSIFHCLGIKFFDLSSVNAEGIVRQLLIFVDIGGVRPVFNLSEFPVRVIDLWRVPGFENGSV